MRKANITALVLVAVVAVAILVFMSLESAVIDDFESYDGRDNRIFDTWVDGFTNNTGSNAGYLEAPFAEQKIVNTGEQSLPLHYDNSAPSFYCEASRTWGRAKDWTVHDANALTLFVRGLAEDQPCRLSVGIEDKMKRLSFVAHPDPNMLTATQWTSRRIPFRKFTDVDMTRVKTMYIGIGNPDDSTSGGVGTVYIDDIRIVYSRVVKP